MRSSAPPASSSTRVCSSSALGPPTLAIDIGGTKTAVALVSKGTVLARRQSPTPARAGPEAVVANSLDLIGEWHHEVTRVGVACTGVVRSERVWAVNQQIMPGWSGFALSAALNRVTQLPVTTINDAQAAAWGEFQYGAASWCTSACFVTVSTGIGGGFVTNGNLVIGADGIAGHVGHIVVASDGLPCVCGRRGCLETIASGSAVSRRAQDFGVTAGAREVIKLALGGEAWAVDVITQAAAALVSAFADIKAVIDPDVIVVGGSFGLNPFFQDLLSNMLSLESHAFVSQLRRATLGADAGLVGAAAWVEGERRTP